MGLTGSRPLFLFLRVGLGVRRRGLVILAVRSFLLLPVGSLVVSVLLPWSHPVILIRQKLLVFKVHAYSLHTYVHTKLKSKVCVLYSKVT